MLRTIRWGQWRVVAKNVVFLKLVSVSYIKMQNHACVHDKRVEVILSRAWWQGIWKAAWDHMFNTQKYTYMKISLINIESYNKIYSELLKKLNL